MKHINYILSAMIFLASCNNSRTPNSTPKLTGNIEVDLKNLLASGVKKADVMDRIRQNPREDELTKKFQDAIKNNYTWFLEYANSIPEGETMPYNPKLGMTKEEYAELVGYMNNIELISSGKEEVNIEIKNDTIRFRSHEKLIDLDSLKIDLKNNIVLYKKYRLLFDDTSNIESDKNALRSKWKGYTWKYDDPKKMGIAEWKDLNNVRTKNYELTIGRLEKNGKSFMNFKGREIENGVSTVQFELPIIF